MIKETVRRTDVEVEKAGDLRQGQQNIESVDDEDFQRHFRSTYGPKGERFEAYRSAYYFAAAESSDLRLRDRDWPEVEENIHRDWERTHPGTWAKVQEAIHFGWDKTRRHH